MIALIEVNDIHVEIIDAKDSATLWKGFTTYDKLRHALIACSERHMWRVDFDAFHEVEMENGRIDYYVRVLTSPSASITAKDLLPEILEDLGVSKND